MNHSQGFRIGLVGAESTHTHHYARTLNAENKFKPWQITHLWGEKEVFTSKTASIGHIKNILNDPLEMLGQIDALIIAHRKGDYHKDVALPFIKKQIPLFIDKPLAHTFADALKIWQTAAKHQCPLTSFSISPMQTNFQDNFQKHLHQEISQINTYGPADYHSPHGGIFFYGIHQMAMILNYLNPRQLTSISMKGDQHLLVGEIKTKNNITANFHFYGPDTEKKGFQYELEINQKIISYDHTYDQEVYGQGIQKFMNLFMARKQIDDALFTLMPIALMEAAVTSYTEKLTVDLKPYLEKMTPLTYQTNG